MTPASLPCLAAFADSCKRAQPLPRRQAPFPCRGCGAAPRSASAKFKIRSVTMGLVITYVNLFKVRAFLSRFVGMVR
eukprot:2949891-Pleurochrysis_carterae.AAC.2